MTLNISLTNLLAGQVTNYLVHDQWYTHDDLKKINYVTAANGLFRVEKTATGIFKTAIVEPVNPIPGLLPMEAGVELLVPKIPFKYLQMALQFYRDIHDKDKTEASLLFFWNKDNKPLPETYDDGTAIQGLLVDGQLVIYVPRQRNTPTLSEFHMDEMVNWFRTNLSLLCETHSHHTMRAFFSATDDANENATQFYGVWGEIKKEQPAFAFRYCSGDSKVEISPDVLFEWPLVNKMIQTTTFILGLGIDAQQTEEEFVFPYEGPFPSIEYPSDWMEQVDRRLISHIRLNLDYAQQLSLQEEGMENFDVMYYSSKHDKENRLDIIDNIRDLTGEYRRLGYDSLIENNIKKYQHAFTGRN